MDYSRRPLADRLAADYVLGTLHGPARRRFENLLPSHANLRQSVLDWQTRLGVLSADISPVEPSAKVWLSIEQRLFGAQTAATDALASVTRWWQRLGLWQGFAAVATVSALSLGLLLEQPSPVQPPIVVVLNSTDPAMQNVSTGAAAQFVASIGGDGRSLVLKPIAGATVTARQALELWALPADGSGPKSLGLVSTDHATTVKRAALLTGTGGLAISVEPSGGSPTGSPTGPVISVGKLQI